MLKTIKDRVIVKVNPKEDTILDSGIIIPAAARAGGTLHRGVVVALGQGHRLNNGAFAPFQVQVGDEVFFWQSNELSRIEYKGEYYYIVKEDAILAVIDNEDSGHN